MELINSLIGATIGILILEMMKKAVNEYMLPLWREYQEQQRRESMPKPEGNDFFGVGDSHHYTVLCRNDADSPWYVAGVYYGLATKELYELASERAIRLANGGYGIRLYEHNRPLQDLEIRSRDNPDTEHTVFTVRFFDDTEAEWLVPYNEVQQWLD